MLESIPTQIDSILGHRIKHERVVWIWGMPQGIDFGALVHHLLFGFDRRLAKIGARSRLTNVPEDSAIAKARGARPLHHKNKTAPNFFGAV